MDPLEIEYVDPTKLDLATYNPRTISKHDFEALKKSIKAFGFVDPVIVNMNNTVVGGNQRVKAAIEMGLEAIPVVMIDVTPSEEKALNIALNRIHGDWDMDLLHEVIIDIQGQGELDYTLTGFTDAELTDILDLHIEDEVIEDVAPPLPRKAKSKRGEVYALGDHRIMCGDATKAEDMEILLGGRLADMMFTDPPWNISIGRDNNPRHKQRDAPLVGDMVLGPEFEAMLSGFAQEAYPRVSGDIYVVMGAKSWPMIDAALRGAGWHWSATIIWNKQRMVLGRSNYHRKYEPLWYGWKDTSSFNGARNQHDVWDIERPHVSKDHPTMKPIALITRAIRNSSHRGDLILDPFMGSGSTIIAADQTDRVALGMEIDPKYVDVIIKRWQNHTGAKATLLGPASPGRG